MAKDKLSFVIGIHCHQPVGNFGWVIEEAYEKSYLPFIDALEDYPEIKITAHYSGPLLEWIEENHPEYLGKLRKLVTEGRMEIMGSGFYEPILMTIPEVDRLEQILKMNLYAEENLGMRPKGAWLTERIWEPSLPKTFDAAGISYTVTDDSHFLQAGIEPAMVRGYYLTEDEGNSCAVFPIDQNLRYAVPFQSPEATVDYLRQRFENGDRTCCTLIDDGEKFGSWPGTHELLYTKEMWLKRFFDLIGEQSDWLEVTTPMEYLQSNPPEGLVYLPTASYFEMGQWTLSPQSNLTLEDLNKRLKDELKEKSEVFLRGGFFRNFFTRYPESNHMHKRMVEVSKKIHMSALEGILRDRAKTDLFKAQCNCAYWHGVFGGLYLPHLRDAIYECLIQAEKQVDKRELAIELYDLDLDGFEEVNLRNSKISTFVAPHDGGSLIEFDALDYNANIINTIARRPEAYHVVKDNGSDGDVGSIHDSRALTEEQKKLLVYDDHRRTCFRDVLLDDDFELGVEELSNLEYEDKFGLSGLAYQVEFSESSKDVVATLTGKSAVSDGIGFGIEKKYTLLKGSSKILLDYSVELIEGDKFSGNFLSQINVSTPSALGIDNPFVLDGTENIQCKLLGSGERDNVKRFSVADPHRQFNAFVEAGEKIKMIWHPLETLSQSESGFERNYQASCVWLVFPAVFKKGERIRFSVKLGTKAL